MRTLFLNIRLLMKSVFFPYHYSDAVTILPQPFGRKCLHWQPGHKGGTQRHHFAPFETPRVYVPSALAFLGAEDPSELV